MKSSLVAQFLVAVIVCTLGYASNASSEESTDDAFSTGSRARVNCGRAAFDIILRRSRTELVDSPLLDELSRKKFLNLNELRQAFQWQGLAAESFPVTWLGVFNQACRERLTNVQRGDLHGVLLCQANGRAFGEVSTQPDHYYVIVAFEGEHISLVEPFTGFQFSVDTNDLLQIDPHASIQFICPPHPWLRRPLADREAIGLWTSFVCLQIGLLYSTRSTRKSTLIQKAT